MDIFGNFQSENDGFRRLYPLSRKKNIYQPKRNMHIQKYKLRSFYAIFSLRVCFFFFYLEAPGTVLMTRAGTPPTTVYAGTSFVTTAPAASTA